MQNVRKSVTFLLSPEQTVPFTAKIAFQKEKVAAIKMVFLGRPNFLGSFDAFPIRSFDYADHPDRCSV